MPRAGFLSQLGWFVVPGFLDAATCAGIRDEMKRSRSDPAQILDEQNRFKLDSGRRKTDIVAVSGETRELVTTRLMEALPKLEKHFEFALAGCEAPSFLVYKEGFYYGRHVDMNASEEAPALFRSRRVSISIFLNGEDEEGGPDTYKGGSLTFYGSRTVDPTSRDPGIAVTGEEGLLLGFRSDWPHEVKPVSRGARFSIVTWFA